MTKANLQFSKDNEYYDQNILTNWKFRDELWNTYEAKNWGVIINNL